MPVRSYAPPVSIRRSSEGRRAGGGHLPVTDGAMGVLSSVVQRLGRVRRLSGTRPGPLPLGGVGQGAALDGTQLGQEADQAGAVEVPFAVAPLDGAPEPAPSTH